MTKLLLSIFLLSIIYYTNAFSGGAPALVCDDMTPLHLAAPQKSKMPHKVTVDKKEVKAGETVEIEISGEYKGLMVEVRSRNKAAGRFIVSNDDRYLKALTCHGAKNSALTHKNSATKKNKKFTWKAPNKPGTYTVVVTVAKDVAVFWARIPTETITVV